MLAGGVGLCEARRQESTRVALPLVVADENCKKGADISVCASTATLNWWTATCEINLQDEKSDRFLCVRMCCLEKLPGAMLD